MLMGQIKNFQCFHCVILQLSGPLKMLIMSLNTFILLKSGFYVCYVLFLINKSSENTKTNSECIY